MTIRIKIDPEILDKIDNTGKELNVNITNVSKLICNFCEIVLEFKRFIGEILEFLEKEDLTESEIAKKVLQIQKKYFK